MADQSSTNTRLSELISWRLIKKNPSGGLIWVTFGAALVMNGYFYLHFLRHKEYQVIDMTYNLLLIDCLFLFINFG